LRSDDGLNALGDGQSDQAGAYAVGTGGSQPRGPDIVGASGHHERLPKRALVGVAGAGWQQRAHAFGRGDFGGQTMFGGELQANVRDQKATDPCGAWEGKVPHLGATERNCHVRNERSVVDRARVKVEAGRAIDRHDTGRGAVSGGSDRGAERHQRRCPLSAKGGQFLCHPLENVAHRASQRGLGARTEQRVDDHVALVHGLRETSTVGIVCSLHDLHAAICGPDLQRVTVGIPLPEIGGAGVSLFLQDCGGDQAIPAVVSRAGQYKHARAVAARSAARCGRLGHRAAGTLHHGGVGVAGSVGCPLQRAHLIRSNDVHGGLLVVEAFQPPYNGARR